MAESFKNKVDALTQFASTDDSALADFLADGCKEIINMMPPFELVAVADEGSAFAPSTGQEVKVPVISVTRKTSTTGDTHQCRLITINQKHEAQDENHVLFATETDPVYYLEPQTTGEQKLKVLPLSSDNLATAVLVEYPGPAVGDSSGIERFPDKYEHLVVLYASIKCIESLLASEEDAELYVPILQTLKQDYTSGLISSGLVSKASKQ